MAQTLVLAQLGPQAGILRNQPSAGMSPLYYAAATSAAAVSLDASTGKAARPGSRASTGSEEQQEAGPFDGVLLLQPQHYQ